MPFCPSLALPYSVWVLRSFPVSLVVANGAETAALRNPKHQAGVALASRYASTTHFRLEDTGKAASEAAPPSTFPTDPTASRRTVCAPSSLLSLCIADQLEAWFLPRSSHFLGNIQIHEIAWVIRPSPLAGEGLGGWGTLGL
jgi:hypothetical protein